MSDKCLCNYINSEIKKGISEEKLIFIMKYADTKIAEYNRSKWSIIKWLSTVTFTTLVTGTFAWMTYYNSYIRTMIVTFLQAFKENAGELGGMIESLKINEDFFMYIVGVSVAVYFYSVLAVIIFKNVRKKKWNILHSNALIEYIFLSKEDD
ncbi:hypothetical protein [Listeria immobilis]|uniref:hypothetical protein n=1 Tax=Listeria immobilis TaxID=2713502 RepID=UPI00164E4694|nr:hypothetical protein [Listeria immobilis]MBC6304263.1 hypothetical protein [Listeria immobilis]MBC6313935.1 hypothetical protein [Listeria immobilis]